MAGSDDKAVSVVQMVQRVVTGCDVTNAQMGSYPKGPLFTFLIGAGFSVTAGVPTTAHLVAALEAFSVAEGQKTWHELFQQTKDAHPTGSVQEIGERYFRLMEEVLAGPRARQAFITAAVRWAATKHVQMNMESVLLAAMLMAGAGRGDGLAEDPGDRSWLLKVFARRAFTTNFDELVPYTFSLGNEPVDVVDGPSPRPISEDLPSVVYLHGRNLHYDLRNTPEELSRWSPDTECPGPFGHFRAALRDTGLIVIGYAGAEDRVVECIRTALHDENSLLFGLWWCAYPGLNAVHPAVREMVEESDRAQYLQPGADARHIMDALSEEVGMGRRRTAATSRPE